MKKFLPGIHKEGCFFISVFIVITIVLFVLSQFLGWIGAILTLWCVFFFRDPKRVTPSGENLLVSPADGIVQKVSIFQLPKEIANTKEEMTRISVFLNIFDVHVNRIPIAGKIVKLHYHHGKFFNAVLDKASEYNERQSILIETNNRKEIGVVQIAGLIARRIICDLKNKQVVKAGERFGIIKFGSRVDIYLPRDIKIKILEGQIMIGGETVIAELDNDLSKKGTFKVVKTTTRVSPKSTAKFLMNSAVKTVSIKPAIKPKVTKIVKPANAKSKEKI